MALDTTGVLTFVWLLVSFNLVLYRPPYEDSKTFQNGVWKC